MAEKTRERETALGVDLAWDEPNFERTLEEDLEHFRRRYKEAYGIDPFPDGIPSSSEKKKPEKK